MRRGLAPLGAIWYCIATTLRTPAAVAGAWHCETFHIHSRPMLSEYLPVVFLLFVGLAVGAVIVVLSWFMGPRTLRLRSAIGPLVRLVPPRRRHRRQREFF